MHLLVFVLCGLLASEGSAAQAQQEDPEGVLDLGETIITPTASERAPMDVPFSGEVISEQQMARRAYRTTPEALRDVPGILLQETAVGHGSPYIRGFTSFRNLFLVDGIRLNNSVFRSGPNQYWNTVDPLLIESLEVVKGPGSVLYGSDSIGGTVNARTRMAYRSSPDDSLAGKLVLRHSSAEQSFVGRLEGSLLGDNGVGVLMGLGGKSFGDLVAGGSTGTQPGTGYDEVNGDLKLDGTSAAGAHWTFAMQHLAQNDVPRTHKTDQAISFHGTTIGSDQRRDLDQERTLVYGQVRGETDAAFFDRYFLSLSWHRQEETRQRTKSNSSRSEQGFDVGQAGLLGNLSSDTSF
ncbi:MAG: hemoglobin/transferrin/lactoferrin receptor protein, partial [Candidatus Paceibacteria bacterium]